VKIQSENIGERERERDEKKICCLGGRRNKKPSKMFAVLKGGC
jgi:hypothetical protein